MDLDELPDPADVAGASPDPSRRRRSVSSRISTHPRVFRQPWSAPQAWEFIAALLVSPSLSVLAPDVTHHEHLAEIIRQVPDVRGNLLHDTHTVALMREHGLRVIYTRDADFHRFPEIEVRDPLR